jgi:hypothetical protein
VATIGQGLHVAGGALAQAIMQRKAQKQREQQLGSLVAALMGPEAKAETMPGYSRTMPLAAQMVPSGPMGAVAGMANQAQLQTGYQGAADEQNKQRELVKALLMSGSPQAEQMAYQMTMPKQQLKGAERYMNLGQGLVFDMAEQSVMDFGGKKPKELKALSPGQVLVDDEGNEIFKVPKSLERKSWQTEVGVGDGMKQKAVFYEPTEQEPEGRMVPIGEPYSATQKVEQMNIDAPPLMGDKVYTRNMANAIAADQDAIVRMERIQQNFEPLYQTIPGKMAQAGLSWADSVVPLGEGKAKNLLQDMTEFQQNTNENVNLYIKMITGAQMSEAEAGRLSKAVANLEDSPAMFERKLQNSIKVMKAAAAKKKEELEYYAGLPGISYEKAQEYAEAAAAKTLRLGMTEIGVDWAEDSPQTKLKEFGGGPKDSKPSNPPPTPPGYSKMEWDGEMWYPVK